MTNKPRIIPELNEDKMEPNQKYQFHTHDGTVLTIREEKFIAYYIECGNAREAVEKAGYFHTVKDTKARNRKLSQYAGTLMKKPKIVNEIGYRLRLLESQRIASAEEIMEYFTKVMRGEIKDQFGLDAPLSERTKAAQELAKRTIDIQQKAAEVAEEPSINIRLIKG